MALNVNRDYINNSSQTAGGKVNTVVSESIKKAIAAAGLEKGDVFKGKIQDITGNSVKILLSGGNTLLATLENGAGFNIGENVNFLVKSNDGTKIILKQVENSGEGRINQSLLTSMEQLGLEASDRNIAMVKEMMAYGMKLDASSVGEMARLAETYSEKPVEDIVSLKTHDIPVTNENLEQLDSYKSYEHKITENIDNLIDKITTLAKENPKLAQSITDSVIKLLQGENVSGNTQEQGIAGENTSGVSENAENVTENLSGKEVLDMASQNGEVSNSNESDTTVKTAADALNTENTGKAGEAANTPDTVKAGETANTPDTVKAGETANTSDAAKAGETANTPDTAKAGETANTPDTAKAGETANTSDAAKAGEAGNTSDTANAGKATNTAYKTENSADKTNAELKQETDRESANNSSTKRLSESLSELKNKWMLNSKMLEGKTGEEIKNIVNKKIQTLYESTEKIMNMLKDGGMEKSDTYKAAENIKNNLQFMNDFNHMASYVQVPYKTLSGEANGELFIYSRNKNKTINDGPITAFLHLDMEHLGATDVRVSMDIAGKVSAKFSLEDKVSQDIVEQHLPELKKRLELLGYTVEVSCEAVNEGEEKSPFEKIMEVDKPRNEIKRYGFDIRL